MLRSKLLGAVLALPLMIAGASSAQANVIALVIDSSGSISSSPAGGNYALQKQGYINALNALLNTDGSNSIGVWQFDQNTVQVFPVTKIDSVSAKNALIAAITAMTQLGGNTGIGTAINVAKGAIQTFVNSLSNCSPAAACGNKIIDVSTDGVENQHTGGADPANPVNASNSAFALGIKVNCLGIGASANCSFNDAAGGTDFPAATFAQFETALKTKLTAELTPTPEPLTMSVFGAGLVGAAALRRRKNKTA